MLNLIVCFGEKELFIHGKLIVVPVQPLLCIQVCGTKHKGCRMDLKLPEGVDVGDRPFFFSQVNSVFLLLNRRATFLA